MHQVDTWCTYTKYFIQTNVISIDKYDVDSFELVLPERGQPKYALQDQNCLSVIMGHNAINSYT